MRRDMPNQVEGRAVDPLQVVQEQTSGRSAWAKAQRTRRSTV